MKSPLELLTCLLKDLKRQEPDTCGIDRDVVTIEARFKHEGVGFFTRALPALCDAFDEGLAKGRFRCPRGLKQVSGGGIPRLFSGILSEVFESQTGLLKQDPNVRLIKFFRELTRLFKKLTLSDKCEKFLDLEAKRKFWECDEEIAGITIPARYTEHLSRVCKYILPTLKGVDYETYRPKHGPGAVAEGYSPNQKWSGLLRDLARSEQKPRSFDESFGLFRYENRDSLAVQEWRKPNCSAREHRNHIPGHSRSVGVPQRQDGSGLPYSKSSEAESIDSGYCARLISVAKNSSSRRTITCEPVALQFEQQHLNKVLREQIVQCRVLSQCLALTDQSKNQKLALEGSLSGVWSTIDLSSASDLLSLELVRVVFAESGTFLSHLEGSRSREVSDGVNVRPLKKYAGMGNATTFPVQSVCFAVVCIAAILDWFGREPTREMVMAIAQYVRVFGDDIIVPIAQTPHIVHWLETVGLKVNRSKSFMEGNFRESCGVDAFRGVDVTPLYLRVLPDSPSLEPSDLASLVATSNLMWERGLYAGADYLKAKVEEYLGYKLPLLPKGFGALGWNDRLGSCTATKWCSKQQGLVVKAPMLKPTEMSDPLDDLPALLKFYMMPGSEVRISETGYMEARQLPHHTSVEPENVGRPVGHLSKSQRRFSSRIVKRWMPAFAGHLVTS
jgi:hypothetical protein